MTLADLNRKIARLPRFTLGELDQAEACVIRDTRLGIWGFTGDIEPNEKLIGLIHDEIWPPAPQIQLL